MTRGTTVVSRSPGSRPKAPFSYDVGVRLVIATTNVVGAMLPIISQSITGEL